MVALLDSKLRVVPFEKKHLYWCKKNLSVSNPEYTKRARMGMWLKGIPKTLDLFEVKGNELSIPYGAKDKFLSAFKDIEITNHYGACDFIDYKANFELYPYQTEAVGIMNLTGYGILQAPPGSGKTQMGLALCAQSGKRCLWITHTKDLLNQSMNRAIECGFDKHLIGTITEGKVLIGEGITFSTVQTLSRVDLNPFQDYWDVVIVDECHRVCGSPTNYTMFWSVLSQLKASHKYGLSATVHRADGFIQALFALIGPVMWTVPDDEVSSTVLPVTIQPITTGYIRHDDTDWSGMLDYCKMINNICSDSNRNMLIKKLLIKHHTEGDSILVLTKRVGHIEELYSMLPFHIQQDTVTITGKTNKRIREQSIASMQSGKARILIATYQLAKEGLDIPRLSVLIMATPEKDYAVVTQSIGRVARKFEGKREPLVYDLVDNDQFLHTMHKKRLASYRKAGCKIELIANSV